MCCDASIVVTVFNSCPICFLFHKLFCDASILVTFNSFLFCFLFYLLWLRVSSGPRVKLASCKSALTPPPPPPGSLLYWPFQGGDPGVSLTRCCFVVYSTRRFVLCLTNLLLVCSICACLDLSVFSSSWCLGRAAVCDCGTPWTFLLPLFLPCVILFLCFSVLLALRLPRLGKRELILVLFVRLFDLCLFRSVGFLFLFVSGKGCGLWLWHSLDFSLTFFLLYWSF